VPLSGACSSWQNELLDGRLVASAWLFGLFLSWLIISSRLRSYYDDRRVGNGEGFGVA